MEAQRERVNPMVGWLKREKGYESVTLRDLVDPQNFAEYLNWVLAHAKGTKHGYSNARMTGVTLGTLSQYLVAMGEIPERTQEGEPVWEALYDLSREPMREGAKRGHLREPPDVGEWTPQALLQLGLEGGRPSRCGVSAATRAAGLTSAWCASAARCSSSWRTKPRCAPATSARCAGTTTSPSNPTAAGASDSPVRSSRSLNAASAPTPTSTPTARR